MNYHWLFDLLAWLSSVVILTRCACTLNSMSWKHWSLFSISVVVLTGASSFVFFVGSELKEYTYPLLIAALVLINVTDKRLWAKREKK